VRGDAVFTDFNFDSGPNSEDGDLDGYAITGDAEYLVWDQGLSLFAGARWATRNFDVSDENLDIDDFQVFAGIKFYFGQGGTLMERQRTGTVDNTSLWNEKLPEFFTSADLGVDF
jgi:hypothetical protein